MTHDLKSKISTFAASRAALLFRAAEDLPLPGAGVAAGDPSAPAPLSDLLRGPMLGKELNEGRIIEAAVAAALESPGASVMRNFKIPVTEPDMNLVAENTFARLAGVRPPAPGRRLGTWEIDIIRHNPATGLFECIDLKRSKLDDNAEVEQRTKVEATAIAALRFFHRLKVKETRVVTLRWNVADQAWSAGIFTPDTIDAHVNAPVRETVEAALAAFRAEFDRRLDLLLRRAMARLSDDTPRAQRAEPPRAPLDDGDAPLTLKEAWKLAMRERRAS